MKVLIVDDSKAMRMIVGRTLRQAGYGDWTFKDATNGAEALQVIPEYQPDLVVSDWNMPEMSGIELVNELKRTNPTVKFGFVTSESTPEMRETALDAGALS